MTLPVIRVVIVSNMIMRHDLLIIEQKEMK